MVIRFLSLNLLILASLAGSEFRIPYPLGRFSGSQEGILFSAEFFPGRRFSLAFPGRDDSENRIRGFYRLAQTADKNRFHMSISADALETGGWPEEFLQVLKVDIRTGEARTGELEVLSSDDRGLPGRLNFCLDGTKIEGTPFRECLLLEKIRGKSGEEF